MKGLQKTCGNISLIERTSDLSIFKAKPIKLQLSEHGELSVLTEVRLFVEKCAIGLNMKIDDQQMQILCDDIIDVYCYDSLEDLRECFKAARQGKYGFGFNRRTSITMELVKEWMAQYLSDKSSLREKLIHNRKSTTEDAPVISKKAVEYLSKIKDAITVKIKEQKDHNPVRDQRISIISVQQKLDNNQELTDQEWAFIDAWKNEETQTN
jgi:hypothetical protein